MFTANEKVAYLKGLAEGSGIDSSTKEGKLFSAIIDTLEEIALNISDLEESFDELSELTEILDEDLGSLEEDFYEDEEEFEGGLYEVVCPECGEEVLLDEDTLDMGETYCPECGELLEFDIVCDCDCDDEDCDCDCDDECGCGCHSEK